MVELATVIYEESRRRLTALFDEETDQQIAFLGGVQVNTPAHMDDYFVIHHFEVRRKGRVRDMQEKLERVVDPDKFRLVPRKPDWKCRACGLKNDDDLNRCRKCGSKRPAATSKK
jgi:hypothetical protein